MRGYGAPQVAFALECLLDDAAEKLSLDAVDVRLLNAARSGDINPVNHKRFIARDSLNALRKDAICSNGTPVRPPVKIKQAICAVASASHVLATVLILTPLALKLREPACCSTKTAR
ncbi:Aldehyde oxidoreductase [Hafnia alvei]|uniref:Aldehyde oxidoreductase n=1 Tax=Hafnia alvei TaxID=569 RepID=A0A377PNS7_HAFAL|nr:Aldehyde oxidoreductase [Hafnia alvei]